MLVSAKAALLSSLSQAAGQKGGSVLSSATRRPPDRKGPNPLNILGVPASAYIPRLARSPWTL